MKKKAYAKINLVLHILNKNENKYHNVDFLMNSVELHDTINIEKSRLDHDTIEVVNYPQLSNESNLAYRALEFFKKEFQINEFYKIKIEKQIPLSGGMAGGSTDAATTLLTLNEITGTNTSKKNLEKIAIKLGMDVPFCLYSNLARATGQGEKIELLKIKIPTTDILVVTIDKELSTKKVYEAYKKSEKKKVNIDNLMKKTEYFKFYSSLENDLENTSEKLEPKIKQIKNIIFNSGIEVVKVMTSGSGPTILVFAPYDNIKELKEYLITKKLDVKIYLTKIRSFK